MKDDYDNEFRHSEEPIPATLGMVPDAPVVYLGAFSKTLFPALRIGFMVMPPTLADAVQDVVDTPLRGGYYTEQRTLARFIEKGHYARHLTAMYHLCHKRQQQLREVLVREVTVPREALDGKGGLHLIAAMGGFDNQAIAQQARQFQLAPATLSHLYLNSQWGRSGLVPGYGNTSVPHYPLALWMLNRPIVQHRRGSA